VATPAQQACFRVDFGRWLAQLPERRRQIAELLVEGHETGIVARQIGVTPGAVSQTRGWLESSWRNFQGEELPS
jgi:DNA-binding NarL/FixJ family response regulator